MLCPIDKTYLDRALFYGTEINFCPSCLGIWFDEDELRLAKDDKDRNLRWLDIDLWAVEDKFKISPGRKLCPRDRLPLYEVRYGNSKVKVDVCNICKGIWLDRGEFREIINYLKERADYETLHNYLKNLKEEFWEIFAGPESFKDEVLDFLTILKLFNYKFLLQHPTISKIISSLPR